MKILSSFLVLFLTTAVLTHTADAATEPAIVRYVLVSQDYDRAKRFYRDVLGFEVRQDGLMGGERFAETQARALKLKPGSLPYFAVLGSGDDGTEIGILGVKGESLQALERPADSAPLAGNHYMVYVVADLAAARSAMEQFETPILREPEQITRFDGTAILEMVILDPDGTRVILQQHVSVEK